MKYKVKINRKSKKYQTKKEAIQAINNHLPKKGINSQTDYAKLYEKNNIFWKFKGCYIRDTEYTTHNGEDIAIPCDNVMLICKHIKDNIDKKCTNTMFVIRAFWLHKKKCNKCKVKNHLFI